MTRELCTRDGLKSRSAIKILKDPFVFIKTHQDPKGGGRTEESRRDRPDDAVGTPGEMRAHARVGFDWAAQFLSCGRSR